MKIAKMITQLKKYNFIRTHQKYETLDMYRVSLGFETFANDSNSTLVITLLRVKINHSLSRAGSVDQIQRTE